MPVGDGYLPPVVVSVLGDASDFMQKVAEVKAALRDIQGAKAEATADLNIGPAETKAAEADALLDALGQKIVEPKIVPQVDIGPALAELAALNAVMNVQSVRQYQAINNGLAAWSLADTAIAASSGGGGRGGFLGALLGGAAAGEAGRGGGGIMKALGFGTSAIPFLGATAGFGTLASLAGFGAEHVIATGLGVAGSAAGALAGGSLLALGTAGVTGVGMGTDLAGIGQAAGDIKNVVQAQNALTQAVAVYGPTSQQAAQAQAQLNYTVGGFNSVAQDAVVGAAATVSQFKTMFDNATGQAEKTGAQILTSAIQVGEQFLPTIGKFAAQNMDIIQQSLTGPEGLFGWLQTTGLSIFTDLEQKFTQQLPTAMHALTQGIELFIKTVDTAAQYTGGFLDKIDAFFTKYNNGSGFASWEGEIGRLINDFRTWWGFLKQIGLTIYDVFHLTVGAGTEVIKVLTTLLTQVDQWLRSSSMSETLSSLFGAHFQQIDAIGKAIAAALPILERFVQAFLQLAAVGTKIFTTVLGPVTALVQLIDQSPIATTLLGWAAALLLINSRLAGLASLGAGAVSSIAGIVGAGSLGTQTAAVVSAGAAGSLAASIAGLILAVPGVDLVGAALLQATGAFNNFDAAVNKSGQTWANQFVAALPSGTDKVAVLQQTMQNLQKSAQGWADTANNMADKKTPWNADAYANAVQQANGLTAQYNGLKKALASLTTQQQTQAAATAAAAQVQSDAALAAQQMNSSLYQTAAAAQAAGNSAQTAATYYQSLLDGELAWLNVNVSTDQSIITVRNNLDALSQSQKQNGVSFDENTAAGRANKTAFDNVVSSIGAMVAAMEKQGVTTTTLNTTLDSQMAQLYAVGRSFGLSTAQVDAMAKSLGLVPKNIETDYALVGVAAVALQIAALNQALQSIPTNIRTNYILSTAGNVPGAFTYSGGDQGGIQSRNKFADGTPNAPGGWSKVGELGPELMYVPQGSRIYSAWQSKQMMAAGLGGTVVHSTIVAQTNASAQDIAREQAWEMRRALVGAA